MKGFWYILLVFCLLMCSCKTQKSAHEIRFVSKVRSDLAYLNESVKISTQNNSYFASEVQNIVIEEDITVTEYDKEGNKTKETNAKRKTTQDSDKVAYEEGQKREESHSQNSLNHFREVTKKIESEVKDESIGGQESFGKWFGIGIACVFGLLLYILLRKLGFINISSTSR